MGRVATAMDTDTLMAQRRAKDEFFRNDPRSPLPEAARATFTGLRYFPPDPAYVFRVPVEPVDVEPVTIGTTDGQERVYHKVGEIALPIDGTEVRLAVYSTGHPGLFLPFRDATSGKETYGAGRYLDLEPDDDGTVVVDFNLAYNPFCAYDEAYSCALPPYDNWLDVPIRAGELTPS